MKRLLFWLSVILWTGVFIWAGVICYLSSLSGTQINEMMKIPVWDKLSHFLAFATGAGLLAGALHYTRSRWRSRRVFVVTVIAISAFGAIDEWHQLYTPERSGADKMDWLADTIGAVVGAIFVCSHYARRNSRKTAPAPARG